MPTLLWTEEAEKMHFLSSVVLLYLKNNLPIILEANFPTLGSSEITLI